MVTCATSCADQSHLAEHPCIFSCFVAYFVAYFCCGLPRSSPSGSASVAASAALEADFADDNGEEGSVNDNTDADNSVACPLTAAAQLELHWLLSVLAIAHGPGRCSARARCSRREYTSSLLRACCKAHVRNLRRQLTCWTKTRACGVRRVGRRHFGATPQPSLLSREHHALLNSAACMGG